MGWGRRAQHAGAHGLDLVLVRGVDRPPQAEDGQAGGQPRPRCRRRSPHPLHGGAGEEGRAAETSKEGGGPAFFPAHVAWAVETGRHGCLLLFFWCFSQGFPSARRSLSCLVLKWRGPHHLGGGSTPRAFPYNLDSGTRRKGNTKKSHTTMAPVCLGCGGMVVPGNGAWADFQVIKSCPRIKNKNSKRTSQNFRPPDGLCPFLGPWGGRFFFCPALCALQKKKRSF